MIGERKKLENGSNVWECLRSETCFLKTTSMEWNSVVCLLKKSNRIWVSLLWGCERNCWRRSTLSSFPKQSLWRQVSEWDLCNLFKGDKTEKGQYHKKFAVENVRPNFSLVLKIDSREILEKVSQVQNRIRGEFPRLPVQLFPLEPTQGLTMFTMPLHNDERLALAQKTLETLKKEIIPKHFPSSNPKVSFRGVANFNNRIVWAETLDDEDKDRLAAFMGNNAQVAHPQLIPLNTLRSKISPSR